MNKYALVFGILLGLADPAFSALPDLVGEVHFYQQACEGSRLGEKKCIQRLKRYCSKPNKWQDGDGKWHDGPSPRQREFCPQMKT